MIFVPKSMFLQLWFCCQFDANNLSKHVMANFVLRLLKRKVVDKTKRPAHKEDASSEDDDGDDEGVIESKFDYDEGVSASAGSINNISLTSSDNVEVRKILRRHSVAVMAVAI